MKSVSDKVKEYARRQLQLATPALIVCKLHKRCVQLIQQCTVNSQENVRSTLNQAQNIIVQLERSLKMEDQLSRSLYLLYDYCYCRLETGQIDDWRKALLIMSNLRDIFDQLNTPVVQC